MTLTYTAYCPLGHSTNLTLEGVGKGLHPPCFCGRETTIYRRGAEPKQQEPAKPRAVKDAEPFA